MIVNETSNSESDKKTISPEQTQYKTIQEKTVDGEKVFTIVAVDDDSGRSLAESIQNLGPIAPIYYMADGVTLVDGRHRLAEAPNACYTKIILKDCDTEVKRIIYDMVLNCNRRKVTPEEYRQKITLLAESGLSVKEIVSKIGLGHTLVDKYYPKPLKQQGRSLAGIASGKARALKAEQQETPAIASSAPMTSTMAPSTNLLSDVDIEKEPDIIKDAFVPFAEQNQSQEPTNEEKADALNAEADREQQQLEKLISDARADLPDDFKHSVYNLAFNPAKELTEKRLNDCLTTAVEVLLDFIEREDALQILLKTASERW